MTYVSPDPDTTDDSVYFHLDGVDEAIHKAAAKWLAEVRLNQGRGEVPMMLASARLYLNGDVERSRRMTALAREMVEAGDKLGAIALVEAVLQRTPEDGGAQRLRAELKPQPQAAK
jgi:hypothetical protein